MAGWDSNSFLLDLSRFGVLDIRPRPGVEVKLPPGADLDKIFVAQQRQVEEYPFEPRMLMRMLQAAPERLKIHLCLSTVRFKRELRVEGPRETHMSIQYHLRLQCAVREFLRLYVNTSTSAEAVRWVPPDERKRRRCNPFEAVPTWRVVFEANRIGPQSFRQAVQTLRGHGFYHVRGAQGAQSEWQHATAPIDAG